MEVLCVIEAVDNGLIVRFDRVKKVKRQVHVASPVEMARLGGAVLRAIRGEDEEWKGEPETPDPNAEPKTENVYVSEPAAIFCPDDAALAAAVAEAKKADEEVRTLGLNRSAFARAVPAGIGRSQALCPPNL